jgi:hypothetical protein
MGGGLFGTPLYLNPKCLVFSAFVLIVYWMPHPTAFAHRILANFVLACIAYVLLSWYDVIFDCEDRLRPTFLGWMWKWAKPQEYRDKYDELPVRYKKIVRDVDIVVLVIAVGLLAYPYIAYRKGA